MTLATRAFSIGSANPTAIAQPAAGVGTQVVLDLYDCVTDRLDDIAWVEAAMTEAARVAGATIVTVVFHKFAPWGISGVVVISESHLAIHIWPENRYAAVDVFTCGSSVDLERAVSYLIGAFQSGRCEIRRFHRGREIGGNSAPAGLRTI